MGAPSMSLAPRAPLGTTEVRGEMRVLRARSASTRTTPRGNASSVQEITKQTPEEILPGQLVEHARMNSTMKTRKMGPRVSRV